ncbi:MAG: hypothetical protein KDD52_01835 [Bdellovibrionales bacterium]|nr:hypothetical protein [Bdellovibrionales bacterium]
MHIQLDLSSKIRNDFPMYRVIFIILGLCILYPFLSVGDAESVPSDVIRKQSGLFTCSGGGSGSALFIQDCKELTVQRAGHGPKYEGTCSDSNNTKFIFACEAFVFEPGKNATQPKTSYER